MTHPRCQLHGSLVALVTPMRGGQVDWVAFERLLEWHLEQGTDGIVVCGTTGESATLTAEEGRTVTIAVKGQPAPIRAQQVIWDLRNGRIQVLKASGTAGR